MNECNVYHTVRRVPVPEQQVQRIIFLVLKDLKKPGVVSVHCIGDRRMMQMNHIYRGTHRATDVLSFAAHEGEWKGRSAHDWGDIFICIPQIERQAGAWGVSVKEEFGRMLIHGLLHLLGYDHEKKRGADAMFGVQEKYVQKWVSM